MRHLRTLLLLRETQSLTRCAQRQHLTQSALSHQIRALEERLGTAVIIRSSRTGLGFTQAGLKLVALAEEVLPRVEAVERNLARFARGDAGRLHIAVDCHSCFDWLLPVLDDFRPRRPAVEIDIETGFAFEALPALRRGDVDLVITSDPVASAAIRYRPLFRYELLLAMHPRHALARRRRILPADLREETLLTYPVPRERLDIFRRFLDPADIEPRVHRQAGLTQLLLQLVSGGRGVAALPAWALVDAARRRQIVTRPFGPERLSAVLYAAVPIETAGLPFVTDFIGTARRVSFRVLKGIEAVDDACNDVPDPLS